MAKGILPCGCLADFNDLLSRSEKREKYLHPFHLIQGFRDAVDGYGLEEVRMVGHPFMWERSRGAQNFVEEKLDSSGFT